MGIKERQREILHTGLMNWDRLRDAYSLICGGSYAFLEHISQLKPESSTLESGLVFVVTRLTSVSATLSWIP